MPPVRAHKRACKRCRSEFHTRQGLWYHNRYVCTGPAVSRVLAPDVVEQCGEVPCERCGVVLSVRLDSSRHWITQRHECAPAPMLAPPPRVDLDLSMDLGDGYGDPDDDPSDPLAPEDTLDWLGRVLLCWAARYNISERAMDQLLRVLALLFSVLCQRGMPSDKPLHQDWPTRFVQLAADRGEEQQLPAVDDEGRPYRDEDIDRFLDEDGKAVDLGELEMDAAMVEAKKAAPVRSERDKQQATRFQRYAMCPHLDCGQLYLPSEALALLDLKLAEGERGRCRRLLSQPVERPSPTDMQREEMQDFKEQSFKPIKLRTGMPTMCGGQVLKVHVRTADRDPDGVGGRPFAPTLLMPYRPICWYLREYLLRPNFECDLDHWKARTLAEVAAEVAAEQAASASSSSPSPDNPPPPLRDIYDGSMWRKHLATLSQSHVLALTLNIDWFQPHKRTQHSTGAVYLCILNLPREQRFLPCNTMLVALLPGPKETSRTQLQSALKPLVEELQRLERGVLIRSARHPRGVNVRAFLMQVVNDLPAARSTCGFASHAGTYGCSVCQLQLCGKEAEGRGSVARHEWHMRHDHSHREQALRWASQMTEAARETCLKQGDQDGGSVGSRWCTLMNAPRFDTVDGLCIDVMHNFFLGTCKTIMELLIKKRDLRVMLRRLRDNGGLTAHLYKELLPEEPAAEARGIRDMLKSKPKAPVQPPPQQPKAAGKAAEKAAILGERDLKFLQQWINDCQCPRSVGRLPGKIDTKTGFSGMKAIEWCNWSAIFCVPAMRDLLLSMDTELLDMDRTLKSGGVKHKDAPDVQQRSVLLLAAMPLFVDCARAAMLMRQYTLTADEVRQVDESLMRILSRVTLLFGADAVTPNMHMSAHVKKYIELWGPPAGWWCFSHERANGILGRFPANNAHVELSMMHRWTVQMNIQQQTCMTRGAEQHLDPASRQMRAMLQEFTFGTERVGAVPDGVGGGGNEELLQRYQNAVSASGNPRQIYTWTNAAAFHLFRRYSHDATMGQQLLGSEPLPGAFRGEGVEYDLRRWLMELPEDSSAHRSLLPASQRRYRDSVHPNHVLECLQHHYQTVYAARLMQLMTARERLDYSTYGDESVVLQNYLPALDTNVRIFNRLDMAGQVYGSRAGGRAERNSYVAVLFNMARDPGKSDEAQYAYGQVQFFMEHSFAAPAKLDRDDPKFGEPGEMMVHRFAVVRWFSSWKDQAKDDVQPAGPRVQYELQSATLLGVNLAGASTNALATARKAKPRDAEAIMLHEVSPLTATYALNQFPVFHPKYGKREMTDLIPVHRLAFKWVPKAEEDTRSKAGKAPQRWLTAARMPSTIHG